MNRFFTWVGICLFFSQLLSFEVFQPYHLLRDLQLEIINEVCQDFGLESSGIASSCYTAICNLYWSFACSDRSISKEEASALLYTIYERIYTRLNECEGLELIKLTPCLDADFLHVVLFFRENKAVGDSSIDLMRGWTTFERYNNKGTSLIFKERRLAEETFKGIVHPAFLSQEQSFFTRTDFTTHLLLRQPFGYLFLDLPDLLREELNGLGIVDFRLEDRACNVCDSSFGVVRKLFFSGKWIDPQPFPQERIGPVFQKAVSKILKTINDSERCKDYLVKHPFSVENIELVLIPSVNHRREESWLQSVYNIGENILFMGCHPSERENLLIQTEKYTDIDNPYQE
ncbi:hypothetical protein [Candidatus Similichlamydia epinepheli]|uniref:hypothetical protein n=1 Tax=Candidatus Similichlamydia epinepheli TaxID=1903953 RepID=UPI000D3441BE|nr:hypothetical protein [Candidatus Similichlamydia epinepheli]